MRLVQAGSLGVRLRAAMNSFRFLQLKTTTVFWKSLNAWLFAMRVFVFVFIRVDPALVRSRCASSESPMSRASALSCPRAPGEGSILFPEMTLDAKSSKPDGMSAFWIRVILRLFNPWPMEGGSRNDFRADPLGPYDPLYCFCYRFHCVVCSSCCSLEGSGLAPTTEAVGAPELGINGCSTST